LEVVKVDLLSFIASMFRSLVWPSCILILIIILKKEISELLSRLGMIRYRDLNLIFERGMEGAKKAVPDVKKLEAFKFHYFESIAELSPRAALLDAWYGFEAQARSIVEALSLVERGEPIQMARLFHVLREGGLINGEEEKALIKLRTIRNEAAHAPEVNLSKEQVAEYAELVTQLTNRIQEQYDNALRQTR
jgi:hypothetical protein